MPRVIYEPTSRTSSIMRVVGLAVAITAAALGATAGQADSTETTATAAAECAPSASADVC